MVFEASPTAVLLDCRAGAIMEDVARRALTPEEVAEREAVAEVASLVRRVLDGTRIYPPGHKTLTGYFAALHDKLTQAMDEAGAVGLDEVALGVTPLGLKYAGEVLQPVDTVNDSFTHALFLDGVHHLVLSRGVSVAELETLAGIWRATLDGNLPDTHTFCTALWEADLASIAVLALESFSESGGESRERSELQTMVDSFSTLDQRGGPGPSEAGQGPAAVSRSAHLSRADLERLRASGMPQLSDADLARFDSPERARVQGLRDDEVQLLSQQLLARGAQRIERAAAALYHAGLSAAPDELVRLRAAFTLVLAAMVKQDMLSRLREVLTQRVAGARVGDPAEMGARFEVLSELMRGLLANSVLEPLVAGLDTPERHPDILATLRFLPLGGASALLGWLSLPERPAARRALADAILHHRPAPKELAERLAWADEETALELLHIARALGEEQAWAAREAGLKHPSPAVRRASVAQLPREVALKHKATLLPLLSSPDPELRGPLFAPMVATRDPAVAGALAELLRRVKIDVSERRRALLAMGTVGGPDACGALRQELSQTTDADLRVTCITALGNAGDEKARPMLEKLAGKLFGGGEVKQAAKAALKQLDALKAKAGAR